MFRSIVVALDLEPDGDRALPVVEVLAAAGDVPVELLTVSSPHVDQAADSFELGRRAAAHGWPTNAFAIAHDDEVARAVVSHVDSREHSLLVMATSAKATLAARFLGSVTEAVLGLVDRPVLLVGPNVPADVELANPTLVVFVDTGDLAEATVPAIVSWTRAFGGGQPLLVVVTDSDRAADEEAPVDRYLALLGAEGVTASTLQVPRTEFRSSLIRVAEQVTDPIFVATSVRWTEPQARGRSTTQRLVHQSTRPVLVVPARYAAWRLPARPSAPTQAVPIDSIQELTAGECWELLAAARVGRLAVCMSGRPGIFPINFAIDEGTIVFRTAAGTKLSALSNVHVAFEIDDYDADSGHASSVIVEGRAAEITGDREQALSLPLFPWHVAPKGHFVRITPDTVSGRRFRAVYARPARRPS